MFYLGIDVSKAKLDCSLLLDQQKGKRKSKVVANSRSGLSDLLVWLEKQGVTPSEVHAIMEGTGVYHELAAGMLHDAGVRVSIANPARVRNFAIGMAIHSKTDGIDSVVLARYGAMKQPPAWSPPPPHIKTLRALLSRHEALSQDLQRERNRLEKAQATETPTLVLQSLQDSISFLERQLADLQKDIKDHSDRHPDLKEDLALLTSITSVGTKVSSHFLCVVHSGDFKRAEQVAAFLGVVPVERQSGSSIKGRARLSKVGPAYLRKMLYMAALSAIRYNPHVKALYERLLLKGKKKMAALGACMRKIVHLCFGVLKNRTPYQKEYLIEKTS